MTDGTQATGAPAGARDVPLPAYRAMQHAPAFPSAPAGGHDAETTAALSALFARLDEEIARDAPLEARMQALASLIDAHAPAVGHHRLRGEMRAAAGAIRRWLAGDATGLGEQFDAIVAADPALTDVPRFFVLLVKHVVDDTRYEPLVMHCRLNRRVRHAQDVLRSPEFVGALARRLRVPGYPQEILRSRVQGVEAVHYAGHQRYAVFSDFVAGLGREGCDTRGGMLLNVLTDEFLDGDLDVVRALFPAEARRLEALGALDPAVLRYLFPLFLTLHDTLGHTLPNSLNHPTKVLAGGFLCDPLEEVGADAQFFWVATAPAMRPFLEPILTEEEIEALPVVWLLKRVCHYPRRGFEHDRVGARLMTDADSRTGLLLWNFFLQHGAIVPAREGYRVDRAALAGASERLLEAWLEIEGGIGRGVEHYRGALAAFAERYGGPADGGAWVLPESLRAAYGAAEAARAEAA